VLSAAVPRHTVRKDGDRGRRGPRQGMGKASARCVPAIVLSMAEMTLPTPYLSDPSLDAESSDGVDLTLIRWTLSLTPLQRLELLQDWVDGLAELRLGRVPKR
jgi:hypothetical protein